MSTPPSPPRSPHPLDSSHYVLKAGDTMTGPLNLPADPVSATQAADKNYVDESVAALNGGLGQKVSTVPTATQIVAQPAGTQLDVNHLNAVLYASQYVTGRGNNGIANAAAGPDCANGCEIKAEQDYAGERFATTTFNNQTHISDSRGGRQADSYLNPLDVVAHGLSTAQSIDDVSTQSEASISQQTGKAPFPAPSPSPSARKPLPVAPTSFPSRSKARHPTSRWPTARCRSPALTTRRASTSLSPSRLTATASATASWARGSSTPRAASATPPMRARIPSICRPTRIPASLPAPARADARAGSTSVTIAATASGGTQGDGRFLIDTNPASVITSASTGGAIIDGTANDPHATAQFSGTSFPVSVLLSTGQVIPSQSGNMAPGTVTFSIATTGVPSGYATNTASN